MTKEMEFFEVKRQYKHVFTEKWEMCSEHSTTGDNKEVVPMADVAAEGPQSSDIASHKKAVNIKASAQKAPKPGKVPKTDGGADPKDKDILEATIVKANKVKKEYHAIWSATGSLLTEVHDPSKSEWAWANHDAVLQPLKDAQAALEGSLRAFDRTFLLKDSAKLKRELGKEHFLVNLEAFLLLGKYVENLGKEQKRLMGMHEASR